MNKRLTQKRINILYAVLLIGLALYASVATVYAISQKDSIDQSFWSGIQNDNSLRMEYQQHIEKYHPDKL